MDVELISRLFEKLNLYACILNGSGKILWIGDKLKELLDINTQHKDNIKDLLGIKVGHILSNDDLQIRIKRQNYTLNKVCSKDKSIIIVFLAAITDYNDYKIKAYCLEEIIKNLNDGILLTDCNGKILVYNKAMEELEKKKSSDMVGKYIWDAYGYKDASKSEHMKVFRSKKPIIDEYKAHAYEGGRPIHKSYSSFPIIKDGVTLGVYTISKDETKLQNLLSEIIELKRKRIGSLKDTEDIKSNGTRWTFSDIIGSSSVMRNLIKIAQSISWLDNNILIIGSTGTGKEVLAQSIHNHGKRKNKPFIGINCSAIPKNLLESILFGSTKGAYTGAVDSPGLFEEAKGGSLFLDELDSMPMSMQAKLLRVLQERHARRVGGNRLYPIKCRIVSAMGKDPYKLIKEGKLRQDLFFRVAGYNLYIPPLKDRGNDLFELVEHFIYKNNKAMNKNVRYITNDLKELMKIYHWPGNIRQLEHFVENIMVRTPDDDLYLRVENIPEYILNFMSFKDKNFCISRKSLPEKLHEIEKNLILKALEYNKWNVTKTARYLGITRQSLNYRMRKFDITRD